MIAIWQIHARVSSPTAALTAAGLLLISLVFSRYVLGLPFTASPMLYLALLGLFHLGLVVPWALGLYNVNRVTWFASYGLSRSLTLVTYSILAYQLGLLAALLGRTPSDGLPIEGDPNIENSKMFVAGNFIFVLGAAMFLLGLIQLDPTGYHKLTNPHTFRLRAESDPRFFGTGMIFASIGLCLSVAGASQPRIRFTLLYTSLWVSMLFYLGFLGPALIACLIVYTLALKKGTEFPRWFPWLALVFLLVAVPIIGVVRDEPLSNRSFNGAVNL